MKKCDFDKDINLIIYECPHCSLLISTLINEIACAIFRHGYNKDTQQQISPHEPKASCDELVKNTNIVGCCKPYQIIQKENEYYVQECDYI